MSSYNIETKNPLTGEWENATWHDDYFGIHRYGVEFPSNGMIFNSEKVSLETRDIRVQENNNMTNNNDLLEKLNTVCPGLYLSQRQVIADFISQNFIPISSLEKFIEENGELPELEPSDIHESGKIVGRISTLKLLKDKFIHNGTNN